MFRIRRVSLDSTNQFLPIGKRIWIQRSDHQKYHKRGPPWVRRSTWGWFCILCVTPTQILCGWNQNVHAHILLWKLQWFSGLFTPVTASACTHTHTNPHWILWGFTSLWKPSSLCHLVKWCPYCSPPLTSLVSRLLTITKWQWPKQNPDPFPLSLKHMVWYQFGDRNSLSQENLTLYLTQFSSLIYQCTLQQELLFLFMSRQHSECTDGISIQEKNRYEIAEENRARQTVPGWLNQALGVRE